jgi:hypothetical protein
MGFKCIMNSRLAVDFRQDLKLAQTKVNFFSEFYKLAQIKVS